MKKVLLTGATGYIGQFAVRHLLDKNYVVHAVTSKPFDKTPTENLIWHRADLLKADDVKDLMEKVCPTHLLHFAWYVEHGKFWNAVENLDWLQAGLFLARQFAECGGERIVTAGTCAEYAWTQTGALTEGKTPMQPQTLYGAAKYALYLALEKFADVSGVSFSGGKVFFLFGADESPNRLVPSVIRALLKNEPAKTSHGEQIRDFMFVEDVAEAFVMLLESDVRGVINIASGRKTKLREIIETLGEITGKPELLQIGALVSNENEPPEIVADITRLTEEVKFNKDFDLRVKLKETVDYWKKVYEIND